MGGANKKTHTNGPMGGPMGPMGPMGGPYCFGIQRAGANSAHIALGSSGRAVSQQASKSASQQASKPASKPASQQASKQASKPASKPASKQASKLQCGAVRCIAKHGLKSGYHMAKMAQQKESFYLGSTGS